MGLLKITKKEFIGMLTCNKTILEGSMFRWNDRRIIARMENIKDISSKVECRIVMKEHANGVVFNNGSRLDFNQVGKKEYFSYKNSYGIQFAIQRTEIFDDFDEEIHLNYVVYIIVP